MTGVEHRIEQIIHFM